MGSVRAAVVSYQKKREQAALAASRPPLPDGLVDLGWMSLQELFYVGVARRGWRILSIDWAADIMVVEVAN